MSLSIIIPALNEAAALPGLIGQLRTGGAEEIVVSDGGSQDGTAAVAEGLGVKVVRGCQGRGRQLNAGAAASIGDILFFLHADSNPPPRFEAIIRSILARPGVHAGSFRLAIAADGRAYRLIESAANFRSRVLGLPYGDQGFFLPRRTFDRLGGYADIPIMEDVDMARRCRGLGKIGIAEESMTVSARRWQKEGWARTTIRNLTILCLFQAGVPARRLAGLYPPLS